MRKLLKEELHDLLSSENSTGMVETIKFCQLRKRANRRSVERIEAYVCFDSTLLINFMALFYRFPGPLDFC